MSGGSARLLPASGCFSTLKHGSLVSGSVLGRARSLKLLLVRSRPKPRGGLCAQVPHLRTLETPFQSHLP
jgi:hypothetical protein